MDLPFHWRMFIKRHRLPMPDMAAADLDLLEEIDSAFSTIPFENATQINRLHEHGPRPETPETLITQHLIHGTGGICYALVNALEDLLKIYGFHPELHHGFVGESRTRAIAGRPNHAALTVEIDGRRHLLDPGMLLRRPLLLEDGPEARLPRVHSDLRETDVLVEQNEKNQLHVMLRSTRGFGHAFTIDLSPTTRADFLGAWKQAFHPLLPADYLVVHKIVDGTMWVLRDHVLASRDSSGRMIEHDASWREIGDRFSIDAPILERAWKRTRYAGVGYRVRSEIARAARSTMSFFMEAAEKRAA